MGVEMRDAMLLVRLPNISSNSPILDQNIARFDEVIPTGAPWAIRFSRFSPLTMGLNASLPWE